MYNDTLLMTGRGGNSEERLRIDNNRSRGWSARPEAGCQGAPEGGGAQSGGKVGLFDNTRLASGSADPGALSGNDVSREKRKYLL